MSLAVKARKLFKLPHISAKEPRLALTGKHPAKEQYEVLPVADIHNMHPWVLRQYRKHGHREVHVATPQPDMRLAVVVPYRNREEHLAAFVPHMKAFFEREGIDAHLYIVQQADSLHFNRAALCNAGFDVAREQCDYVVFHDIDMLPERSNYHWMNHPTQIIHEGYPVGYFGGITLFPKEQFERVNGFGNHFWHWGWEDVDIRDRCFVAGLTPLRQKTAEYTMLPHPCSTTRSADGTYETDKAKIRELKKKRNLNRDRYLQFAKGKRSHLDDGLKQLLYDLLDRKESEGVTQVDVSLEKLWAAKGE